jgi:hypothetical protein
VNLRRGGGGGEARGEGSGVELRGGRGEERGGLVFHPFSVVGSLDQRFTMMKGC